MDDSGSQAVFQKSGKSPILEALFDLYESEVDQLMMTREEMAQKLVEIAGKKRILALLGKPEVMKSLTKADILRAFSKEDLVRVLTKKGFLRAFSKEDLWAALNQEDPKAGRSYRRSPEKRTVAKNNHDKIEAGKSTQNTRRGRPQLV